MTSIPPLRVDAGGSAAVPAGSAPDRSELRPITWSPVRRRTVLRAGAAIGSAIGMAAIGVFPAARRARADGFDIYPSCPSYAADHNCSPGCGPSTIFGDSCNLSGPNLGFHKNDGVTWMLRPNQCFQNMYDGWVWRFQGACGTCACFVERRCNDGYRMTSAGWVKSICRWNTDCGCQGAVTWATVQRGNTGANVSVVQQLLNFHGAALTVDGDFGPLTEAAVQSFQSSSNLPDTGVVDATTWPVLVVTVRKNDSGDGVKAAQRALNKWGYSLTVDGVFGTLTDGAARDFQRQNALTADGVIGQNTWRTLIGGAGI